MASLESIISLCKRRGFVYQSAEIYGGINGIYDFGHLGTLMLQNIRNAWLDTLESSGQTILFFEGALLGPEAVWKASGHLDHFNDPMVDCTHCKRRYRADELDLAKACPHCGKKAWTEIRQFNMMFETNIGAAADLATKAYLRPETAQTIFINFKNILATNRVKIPFGVAQIGKAFRNEINPKQFLFRVREFEQMELEWFCKEEQAQYYYEYWCKERVSWYKKIGINPEHIRLRSYEKHELAHYSLATSDIEYSYPFGWKELEGIAHRSNFDLMQHGTFSGKDTSVFDEKTKTSFVPHVIESSVGAGRLFLTLFFDAYHEEAVEDEQRVVLKFSPTIAPIKAAIFPLTKEQIEPAHALFLSLKKEGFSVLFDDSGSIGKRYRRQDEIGTPICITYDFESAQDQSVTIRDRDTMTQKRIKLDTINSYIKNLVKV